MILRNYDNILTFGKIAFTNSKIPKDNVGDGYLGLLGQEGKIEDQYISCTKPFNNFLTLVNGKYHGSSVGSNLVCGYDENEVTYDDYKIEKVTSGLNHTAHSSSDIVYDEASNTYTREYYKIYSNTSAETKTINCIGVTYSSSTNVSAILVYKEKLPEPVEIPGYGAIRLKLKMTVSGNPNKPMEVTASVE